LKGLPEDLKAKLLRKALKMKSKLRRASSSAVAPPAEEMQEVEPRNVASSMPSSNEAFLTAVTPPPVPEVDVFTVSE
jgi:hypothetical protein